MTGIRAMRSIVVESQDAATFSPVFTVTQTVGLIACRSLSQRLCGRRPTAMADWYFTNTRTYASAARGWWSSRMGEVSKVFEAVRELTKYASYRCGFRKRIWQCTEGKAVQHCHVNGKHRNIKVIMPKK
jgi:hypothetical protein